MLDAGSWSRELFAGFDDAGPSSFSNIKQIEPERRAEVERALRTVLTRRGPDAASDWETRKNGQIRREVWRVTAGEDAGVWRTQGRATLALGVLRMIASNLVHWLRRRHVRVRHVRVAETPRP